MSFKNKSKLLNESGYALIEQIVSVVLVGVISVSMAMFLGSTNLTFEQISNRKELIVDNTIGLEIVGQDFANIYNILSYDTKSIQFTTTRDTSTIIEYKLASNGSLNRKKGIGLYMPISQNIVYNSSNFSFYDINGNTSGPIKRIRLYLLYSVNNITSPITLDIAPRAI